MLDPEGFVNKQPKGRCGNCEYWRPPAPSGAYSTYGGCMLIEAPRKYGELSAYVSEWFETKADFGCVLWEAKEKDADA